MTTSSAGTDADSVLGDGHVVLVTGSTSGIGRETARNLAATGAAVLVHGRDRERARGTVADLPGAGHDWYLADFADLGEVRGLADDVLADYDRIDCLVNNAGTMRGDRHLVDVPGADEGVELTFVVNHLAPFLLTHLLGHRLQTTGEQRGVDGSQQRDDPARDASTRVVTVSSGVHTRATMDLDAVRGPDGPRAMNAYALSKLANVQFTMELARRLPEVVTANCCHPGVSPSTSLGRDGSFLPGLGWRLFGVVGGVLGMTDSVHESAETQTYLARSPEVSGVSGEYFEDCERARPSDGALDREAQRDLWDASEEWVELASGRAFVE